MAIEAQPVLTDLSTLLEVVNRPPGGNFGPQHYYETVTEVVAMLTTTSAGSTVTWRPSLDCYLLGALTASANSFCLSIGSDPPAQMPSGSPLVVTGVALPYFFTFGQSNQFIPLRTKIAANEAVNLKTYIANAVGMILVIGYTRLVQRP